MNKKDFVNIINTFTGEKTMTEEKLVKFLSGASLAMKSKGDKGFFDYIRKSLQIDLPDSFLGMITSQLQNSNTLKDVVDQYKLPQELKNIDKTTKKKK